MSKAILIQVGSTKINEEQYAKHYKAIQAWKQGEEIEFRTGNYGWTRADEDPLWSMDAEYRAKLKPALIPFEFADRDLFRGKWVRRKSDGCEFCPSEIYTKSVYFQAGHHATYPDFMEKFEFLDGTPCGKYVTK